MSNADALALFKTLVVIVVFLYHVMSFIMKYKVLFPVLFW